MYLWFGWKGLLRGTGQQDGLAGEGACWDLSLIAGSYWERHDQFLKVIL